MCEETPAKAVGPTRAEGGQGLPRVSQTLHLTNREAEVVRFLKAPQSKLATDPEWAGGTLPVPGRTSFSPDSPEETEALI